MNKRGGTGFIRLLLTLVLLALVGYNTFEISQLRAEIARLRGERGTVIAETKRAKGSASIADLAGSVQQHTERARKLLGEKNYAGAQEEIKQAAQAARDAGAGGEKALADLRDTARHLADRAQAMLPSKERSGGGTNSTGKTP